MDLDVSWWKIGFWIFGTFGIAGIIAAAALYPVVFAALVRFARLVFSSRIGCAVVAAILAAVIADYWRHSIEDTRHAAAAEAFRVAQIDRDKRIATDTRERVLKEIEAERAESAAIDKGVKDFTDALPKLSPAVCGGPVPTGNPFLVAGDAARLRDIFGQPRRRSDGAQGVPQTDAPPARLRDRIRQRLSRTGGGSGRSDQ